ncbi:MAG: hypothetical protein ABIQ06_07180 [Caldimonas sp.]
MFAWGLSSTFDARRFDRLEQGETVTASCARHFREHLSPASGEVLLPGRR